MLVRYSAHTKDSMVGKTEEVSEERGERLIATGVAHRAEEPEPTKAAEPEQADGSSAAQAAALSDWLAAEAKWQSEVDETVKAKTPAASGSRRAPAAPAS